MKWSWESCTLFKQVLHFWSYDVANFQAGQTLSLNVSWNAFVIISDTFICVHHFLIQIKCTDLTSCRHLNDRWPIGWTWWWVVLQFCTIQNRWTIAFVLCPELWIQQMRLFPNLTQSTIRIRTSVVEVKYACLTKFIWWLEWVVKERVFFYNFEPLVLNWS